ncbi:choice-of-anchor J domain-containing protein [uncultured Bacteroides sp.]|uniref:choice-of-anchor J domain-containing protein n=1 Tax=uncultured Bacteroides sp. TaxID=162156 RepID=UPI002AAB7547|nr:choice-of-anchor J domain-containing protein [uncultured Bacteroides sp.]
MKKYILLSFVGALSILSSCNYNDKYFDGLDDLVTPTNKLALEYTLADADYATISTSSKNIALVPIKSDSLLLAAIKTNKYFADAEQVHKFMPAFLASKWYSASEGSAVKVTYKKSINLPDYVAKLNDTSKNWYTVSTSDYKTIWGANSSVNFFTPSKPASTNIPVFLAAAYPNAVSGDVVAVNYNESASEPTSVAALSEDFEAPAVGNVAVVSGWSNIATTGTYTWAEKSFSNNKYIQASAYNHAAGPLEIYMVSPSFTVSSGQVFSFDACLGNYKAEGGKLTVLISSNLAGTAASDIAAATWDDVTSNFTIPIPTSTYGTLGKVGELLLSKYVGKKINIAFRYNGDGTTGATTTVQVDNAVVAKASGAYTSTGLLYTYNGTKWVAYTGNSYFLTKADFSAMGSNYDNFSATMNADNYVPQFLKLKYPYAQEGDKKAVAYKYYASSSTVIRADEYTYTKGTWVKTNSVTNFTDQFVYTNGAWKYDPSVVVDLDPVKKLSSTAAFYQAITDYVWTKIDQPAGVTKKGNGYVTSYGNNEYYYGTSAFQFNVDFRPSAWKAQNSSAYTSLTDDQLKAKMNERLPEAFIPALEKMYPDAVTVAGVNVTYTINFGIFTGDKLSGNTHTIVYKVIDKGKFEYVKDSFQAL